MVLLADERGVLFAFDIHEMGLIWKIETSIAMAMDYDVTTRDIYLADIKKRTVERVQFGGGEGEVIAKLDSSEYKIHKSINQSTLFISILCHRPVIQWQYRKSETQGASYICTSIVFDGVFVRAVCLILLFLSSDTLSPSHRIMGGFTVWMIT